MSITTTRITMFTITAMAAAAVSVPAAHAAPPSRQFLSPSGDVGCEMGTAADGTEFAWCEADGPAWVAPPVGFCPLANVPGAIGEPGGQDLQIAQGKSVGPITCAVKASGVKCTDSETGRSSRCRGTPICWAEIGFD